MADITRRTKHYPSDLTDKEWERIALLMQPANRRGRKQVTDFREIIRQSNPAKGFAVLPRQWVVEWTFVYSLAPTGEGL